MSSFKTVSLLVLLAYLTANPALADEVRIKDLGHFLGWRENALVGYGIVIGLGGSGDSPRSAVTRQALTNVLSRFGANLSADQIQSRNVAAVMITATLPPSSNIGDKIDATVSSIGDARSLAGGTLLMTPLLGPDQHPHALAQGAIVVGGYRFDSNQNVEQKNYPTSGIVSGGATVETPVRADLRDKGQDLVFVLNEPDFTTAQRIADRIDTILGIGAAEVLGADRVSTRAPAADAALYRLVSRIENLEVTPQTLSRVVINERSGTVVAGGDTQISSVVISQGDIRVSVSIDNQAPFQPQFGGYGQSEGRGGGHSLVVTNTKLEVTEPDRNIVVRFPSTTVADLVEGLQRVHVDTRGVINVLQAIKAAGSLHAELIVQ